MPYRGDPARVPRAGSRNRLTRRRRLQRVTAGRALRALPILLPLALSGCTRPPNDDLEAAARAMERAAAAGWTAGGPSFCSEGQSLLLRARTEATLQGKRWFLARDYDESALLAHAARADAAQCADYAEAMRQRTQRRAEARLKALEERIGQAATLARHVPDREAIDADLLKAELTLGEGKTSLERGQVERADETIARGMQKVGDALAAIDKAFAAYSGDPRRRLWKRWITETIDASARDRGPTILVDKLRRQLYLLRRGEVEATYPVDLGIAGTGSKTMAGDEATPEGRYRITEVRDPGRTRYYRALMLDYPNDEDRANFRRLQRSGKVTSRQQIGSNIEIHGQGGRGEDWTQGCVALTDADMDDLVPRVAVGTRVTIVGTIPDDVTP